LIGLGRGLERELLDELAVAPVALLSRVLLLRARIGAQALDVLETLLITFAQLFDAPAPELDLGLGALHLEIAAGTPDREYRGREKSDDRGDVVDFLGV